MKYGDLVYLKDVGCPYDGTGSGPGGEESWEGASCRVLSVKAGVSRDMVEVAPLFPVGGMNSALFFPSQVKKETRTWLRKNIQRILVTRQTLDSTIQVLQDLRLDKPAKSVTS